MKPWTSRILSLAVLVPLAACSSSSDDDDGGGGGSPAIPAAKNGTVVALTEDSRLITFDPGTPGTLTSNRTINGLQLLESIVAIDFRPATGELYGFSSQARLYKIDPDDGNATLVGSGPIAPLPTGTEFGFDFNPSVDRIRLTSDDDENLRLHPDSGLVVATDTSLAFAALDPNFGTDPAVTAVAYTNNFAGATSTALFGIDAENDVLVIINPPNNGALSTVGSIGVDATNSMGFDISPSGGAFAVENLPAATSSRLYAVNLTTGSLGLLGTIGGTALVRDIALRPASAPRIWVLGAANQLVSIRPAAPNTLLSNVTIDGLQVGETILAIDIRPASGELYGLGSTSRLYQIDEDDGDAHLVGSGAFTPTLAGTEFDIDFNPRIDRLRVVSDQDQNLVLNPNSGVVTSTDTSVIYEAGDLSFGMNPKLVGIGYSNNFSGAASTTVFGIDTDQDTLVRLGSVGGSPNGPATGLLTTIGGLSVDATDPAGMDISSDGVGWLVMTETGLLLPQLYTVNLTTGVTTTIGLIGITAAKDLAVDLPVVPLIFGLTTTNRLVSFRPATPSILFSDTQITGLQAGETLLGIDFRPSTSELYAVGDSDRLYTIDRTSGAVVLVGSGPFAPSITGVEVGMDFNPLFDPLRVAGDDGQNLRFNVTTGVATTDTPLAYDAGDPNNGTPVHVTAVAYSNSFTAGTMTTAYAIDTNLDSLVTIGSVNGTPSLPNTGLVFTVGAPLGVAATDLAGFDISTAGAGFLALTASAATSSDLYSVNLSTGAALLLGTVGGTSVFLLRDIAVFPLGL